MDDARLEARSPLPMWVQFAIEVRRRVYRISCHGIATCTAVLSMALTEMILSSTLGHGVKFYDLIPVRYVIQAVEVALLARFVINVWRESR